MRILLSVLAVSTWLAGCNSPDAERGRGNVREEGLLVSTPDTEGYVTSAFQGVKAYDSMAMLYICVTLGVQSGKMPDGPLIMGKAFKSNLGKIDVEQSGLLFKDATNFWRINSDIDKDVFWVDRCQIPMANLQKLYGN